jgi:hypothetical protein
MPKYKCQIRVKKEHSQSETAIPCYHVSQPEMTLIKLLN